MVKSTIIVFVPYFKFSAKNTIMLTLLGNKHASKYHFCCPLRCHRCQLLKTCGCCTEHAYNYVNTWFTVMITSGQPLYYRDSECIPNYRPALLHTLVLYLDLLIGLAEISVGFICRVQQLHNWALCLGGLVDKVLRLQAIIGRYYAAWNLT